MRYKLVYYQPVNDARVVMDCVIDVPCILYAENSSKIYEGQNVVANGPSFDIDLLQRIPVQSEHGVVYRNFARMYR